MPAVAQHATLAVLFKLPGHIYPAADAAGDQLSAIRNVINRYTVHQLTREHPLQAPCSLLRRADQTYAGSH
jgi:hypothetical protein